jgi:hypothetical protein
VVIGKYLPKKTGIGAVAIDRAAESPTNNVVPMKLPSCPSLLLPQHTTLPSASMAQLFTEPTLNATIAAGGVYSGDLLYPPSSNAGCTPGAPRS